MEKEKLFNFFQSHEQTPTMEEENSFNSLPLQQQNLNEQLID